MPTLYTQAESNIRKTWILMVGFLGLTILLGWALSYFLGNRIFLILAIFFAFFQSFLSYWYSDKIVLASTRARPIEKKDQPELYRLLENLCITAGLPLPKLYLLNENQINAFATGRDANHAVIAVTKGALEKLEKTELEGVIAHELSHIGNKDMLLMTVVVILVGFVSILSDFFLRSFWWGEVRKKEERSGETGSFLAFLGIILAVLSPFIALLIQLAISRKREFLADATGALLTRYPEGLARALEKIAKDNTPMKNVSAATAHLFISNPFKGKSLMNLFLTHPPIEERIRALREMEI